MPYLTIQINNTFIRKKSNTATEQEQNFRPRHPKESGRIVRPFLLEYSFFLLSLLFCNSILQQIRHTAHTDIQRRTIMKQGGSRRHQDTCDAQKYQSQIESDHKPIISLDPFHQPCTDLTQRHQAVQAIPCDHDIRHFSGDRRAAADGYPRVCG